jgi:Dyp-type peroxidase family
MTKVEWSDVQGLILSGYPKLPRAAYILWQFVPGQPQEAKGWLKDLAERVTVATSRGEDKAINVALSASALRKLDVKERSAFSPEFLEGMAPSPPANLPISRRSSQLGDIGSNDPKNWLWGGHTGNSEIDGVLLLYAPCKHAIEALLALELEYMHGAAAPINCPHTGQPLILDAYLRCDSTEHFGFRDGISQPFIKGTEDAKKLSRKQARFDVIKPGEFIIGYEGERDRVPAGFAAPAQAANNLQRNGTYLVFRHLEQDVGAFDAFLTKAAQTALGSTSSRAREWVAARLIGRWRNGRPLIDPPFADREMATTIGPRNDFLYHYEDRFGLACPIGAHIRRANPRDSLSTDPDTALRLSKMHRIIRRGRLYGPHVARNGADDTAGIKGRRGIHFMCLNADIAGQFELIQHSWLNNTHVGGLYDECDPLFNRKAEGGSLTIQQRPINLRLNSIPQFVTVRGGAYFFMPGVAALSQMAKQ